MRGDDPRSVTDVGRIEFEANVRIAALKVAVGLESVRDSTNALNAARKFEEYIRGEKLL